MKVGIVGLGLIGGSFARAYKEAGHTVLAYNRSRSTLDFAMLSGVVDGELNKENISSCELILVALYPKATVEYISSMAPYIGPSPLVIDCDGIKSEICASVFPLAKQYGFTFIGGHPMAGTHNSGFKYSRANMYHNAPMVLCPPDFDDIDLMSRAESLLSPCGFGKYSFTTPEEHDRLIAFTSQLAHVVSNAYIKSPTARAHRGFSAGSYKDMTRVAWLNPEMWAELFLENKQYLIFELDEIISSLTEYKTAIEDNDRTTLVRLLDDGRKIKKEVDG